MTLCRQALTSCLVGAMCYVSRCEAGNWGADATFGVLGDYSTDPALLHQQDTEVGSSAVQIAAPIAYDDGSFKFTALPNLRVGTDSGYDTVTSDYEHLDLKGEYNSDRDSLSINAGAAQDSSLSYSYLINGATGVRRDALTGELKWDHHLTERLEVFSTFDEQRIEFAQNKGTQLSDYGYSGISSGISWLNSARDKVTLQADAARYYTFDTHDEFGFPTSTESRSGNVQVGITHQLSELWTFTALAGASRELDRSSYNLYFPYFMEVVVVPVVQDTGKNSAVYSTDLSHSGSRLSVGATLSRQYLPSGFAYLTRQDTYDLKADYTLSERWSIGADARYVRYQNPPGVAVTSPDVAVRYVSLYTAWHWTELWTVTFTTTRLSETYARNPYTLASNEVTLTLSRQFGHFTL